eukprot:TRINITY_DN1221_c0_g1_i1.p1 TRINITY_DN1221_c0_g1~~TRINITY_DN1221_c0_g1_i1.p1  ORF type:complete len:874 (+),score=149.94 TRINITY_DN1221_c0_g1_i1:28-2649(+)
MNQGKVKNTPTVNTEYLTENVHVCFTSSAQKVKKFSERSIQLREHSFVISKTKKEREFFYYFIKQLAYDPNLNQILLEIETRPEKSTYIVVKSHKSQRIASTIFELYNEITTNWPEDAKIIFTGLSCNLTPKPKPLDGFPYTYSAYCHMNLVEPTNCVLNYILNLNHKKVYDLDLSACPGVESKSQWLFNLPTLGYALRYNTYFKSIIMNELENKEANFALAIILSGNRTMYKVVSKNNGEMPEILGDALQHNTNHKIQILQLTDNEFSSKAARSFFLGLSSFKHVLRVLDLTNTGIGSALGSLIDALSSNIPLILSIEELSLAGNTVNSSSHQKLLGLFSDIRKNSSLKRLSLAGMGIDTGAILILLASIPLEYMNISYNLCEKSTLGNWVVYAELVNGIKTIDASGLGIGADIVSKFIKQLAKNTTITELDLNLSHNNFGSDAAQLGPALQSFVALKVLDLSDNGIKEKGSTDILRHIHPSLKKLVFNRNIGTNEKSEHKMNFVKTLAQFIAHHPSCTSISIAGGSGYKIGPLISIMFGDSANNKYLQELDISGNNIGDDAFSKFCVCMVQNIGLKSLKFDGNNISVYGLRSFMQMLNSNSTLSYVEFPEIDFKNSKDPSRYLELIMSIDSNLSIRRNLNDAVWSANPFLFDLKWPTPTTPPTMLKDKKVSDQVSIISSRSRSGTKLPPPTPGIPLKLSKNIVFTSYGHLSKGVEETEGSGNNIKTPRIQRSQSIDDFVKNHENKLRRSSECIVPLSSSQSMKTTLKDKIIEEDSGEEGTPNKREIKVKRPAVTNSNTSVDDTDEKSDKSMSSTFSPVDNSSSTAPIVPWYKKLHVEFYSIDQVVFGWAGKDTIDYSIECFIITLILIVRR